MTFAFTPAVRERVSLIIGIAGTTGSGKTLSALKIARGLCAGDDSRIAAIDTESGRLKHYAPAPGEKPGPDRFGFMYGALHAPFTPEAYIDAIKAADEAGFEVILIDSFSHVWEGDGGLHDIHDEDTEKAVEKSRAQAIERGWNFDEAAAAEKASLGAWKAPKRRHKRMVSRLLQCRAHLIICMRAEEKLRMEQVVERRNGREYKKTVITAAKDLPLVERWVPSVEKRFPYELTLSFIVAPTDPGVPIPLKLQQQHRPAVPLDRPLTEETGRQLAAWANGGAVTPIAPQAAQQPAKPTDTPPAPTALDPAEVERLRAMGDEAADRGLDVVDTFFGNLPPAAKTALKPHVRRWMTRGKEVDAASLNEASDAA